MHGQQAHQMVLSSLTDVGQQRTNAFGRMGLTFGISFLFVPIISTGCSRLFGTAGDRVPILVAIVIAFGAIGILLSYLSQYISVTLFDSNEYLPIVQTYLMFHYFFLSFFLSRNTR
jgi:hypothetical protein